MTVYLHALDLAAKGAVILGVGLVAVRLMRRQSAAARHFALVLTLAGIVALPLLSGILPRLPVLPRWMELRPPSALPLARVGDTALPSPKDSDTAPLRVEQANQSVAESSAVDASRWSMPAFIALIWAIGAMAVLSSTAGGLLSLRRLARTSREPSSGALLSILRQVQVELGLRRGVRLLVSGQRRMPMTWGVFSCTILLPAEANEWPAERLRLVLLHELAHARRGDFLTRLLSRLACALYWFNPLVWLAASRLESEQELACDDLVLAHGSSPASYAAEVLHFAAGARGLCIESLGAVAMARPSSLEGRLLAILDPSLNRALPTRGKMILTFAFAAAVIAPLSMLHAGYAFVRPLAREDGLVAWWRGDGDGRDSAGHHDGAFPFGQKYLPGLHGAALDFVRSDAREDQLRRVSIPDSPDFQLAESFTLETWIYPVSYGGIVCLRGDDRGGFENWEIDLATRGRITFAFNADDNRSDGLSAPINLRQWQHVVASFDHGTLRLYLNGLLAAQKTTGLRPISILEPSEHPAIGIGNAGGTFHNMPFNGLIDEVRLYNRALSEAEIERRMRE